MKSVIFNGKNSLEVLDLCREIYPNLRVNFKNSKKIYFISDLEYSNDTKLVYVTKGDEVGFSIKRKGDYIFPCLFINGKAV